MMIFKDIETYFTDDEKKFIIYALTRNIVLPVPVMKNLGYFKIDTVMECLDKRKFFHDTGVEGENTVLTVEGEAMRKRVEKKVFYGICEYLKSLIDVILD